MPQKFDLLLLPGNKKKDYLRQVEIHQITATKHINNDILLMPLFRKKGRKKYTLASYFFKKETAALNLFSKPPF